jgi:hypothetical protein
VAVLVLQLGRKCDAKALIEHRRYKIAGYKNSRTVDLIDESPRLVNEEVTKK